MYLMNKIKVFALTGNAGKKVVSQCPEGLYRCPDGLCKNSERDC